MSDNDESAAAHTGLRYATTTHMELSGPVGYNLNLAVAHAIELGLTVKFIEAGRYRLTGLHARADMQKWIDFYMPAGPIVVELEMPPDGTVKVRFDVRPARPSARTTTIHGLKGYSGMVAAAIDAGLTVGIAGFRRFCVSGPTMMQAEWLAASVMNTTLSKAFETMGLTEAAARAEDSAAPALPPITINLPKRETLSSVTHDRQGNITGMTQIERSIK